MSDSPKRRQFISLAQAVTDAQTATSEVAVSPELSELLRIAGDTQAVAVSTEFRDLVDVTGAAQTAASAVADLTGLAETFTTVTESTSAIDCLGVLEAPETFEASTTALESTLPSQDVEPQQPVPVVANEPDALSILNSAMGPKGFNVASLTKEVNRVFKKRKGSPKRVDKTTIRRIVNGQTKGPNVATVSALIQALELSPAQAELVRSRLRRK
jgi:hypothetical protein